MTRTFRLLGWTAGLLFALRGSAQTDVVGVYLTWKKDPATTMTVNWVNLYPQSPTQLWFRSGTNSPWQTTKGARSVLKPASLQLHRVELSGLAPDTLYDFVLTEAPTAEPKNVRRFRTMPATLQRPIRFVAGGDMMHQRDWVDAMNQQAGQLEPDFAVLGGDLAYEDGRQATRWLDWLQSWMLNARGTNARCIPILAAIGNHEVRGGYKGKAPEDAPYFFGLFVPPGAKTYRAVDFGHYLSFLLLDSGHIEDVAGKQASWLERALASRTQQKFLFPVYHYPAYGTAKAETNTLPCDLPRAKVIREHWVPLFERHGVTAVLENDHHNYKRTHPLRRHQRDDTNGIVYLGDGAWGVTTRTVPTNAWYLAHAEPRRHLYLITLNPEGNVTATAIEANGTAFDSARFDRPRTIPEKP